MLKEFREFAVKGNVIDLAIGVIIGAAFSRIIESLVADIVMPILGMMTAWTDGKSLFIPFTDIALPALMAENEALAHQLEDLHGQIGDIFYWVIGFHVLAALYHHFVRKDNTLSRMT